jgi:tetratricopeptide (TPR) repeat protein
MPKDKPMRKIMVLLVAIAVAAAGTAMAQVDTQNPSTARDFYERGLKREEAKQFKDAIADYTKAAELDPGLFDAHFTLSSLYAELRDYRAAIDALADGLKARPKDYSALFNFGLYHEYLRDYDSAIAHYTQASSDDADFSHYGGPTDQARAHAYHYRGRVYQWHKKDPKSKWFDTAVHWLITTSRTTQTQMLTLLRPVI